MGVFYLRASVWRCTVRVKLAARPTPIACPLCHRATKWKAGATHSFPKNREKERKANTVPATKREETRDVRIFFFYFNCSESQQSLPRCGKPKPSLCRLPLKIINHAALFESQQYMRTFSEETRMRMSEAYIIKVACSRHASLSPLRTPEHGNNSGASPCHPISKQSLASRKGSRCSGSQNGVMNAGRDRVREKGTPRDE